MTPIIPSSASIVVGAALAGLSLNPLEAWTPGALGFRRWAKRSRSGFNAAAESKFPCGIAGDLLPGSRTGERIARNPLRDGNPGVLVIQMLPLQREATRIIELLEREHPEPALYPEDAQKRRQA